MFNQINWIKFVLFAVFVTGGGVLIYDAGFNGISLFPPLSAFGGMVGVLVFVGACVGVIVAVITEWLWLRIVAVVAAFVLGVIFKGLAGGLGEFFSSLSLAQLLVSIVAVIFVAVFGLWLSRRD